MSGAVKAEQSVGLPTDVLIAWLREHADRENSTWIRECADRMQTLNTAPTVDESKALEAFDSYFAHNYPPGVRIGDPHWHAPKIFRAVRDALRGT